MKQKPQCMDRNQKFQISQGQKSINSAMKYVKSKINKIIQVNTTATANTGQALRLLDKVMLKVKFDRFQSK